MDKKKLITSIIEDISNNKGDVNFLFRKVQILSYYLDNENLTRWYTSEANGYDKNHELPPYRKLNIILKGNLEENRGFSLAPHNDFTLPIGHLKKEEQELFSTYNCYDPIREIGSIVADCKSSHLNVTCSLLAIPLIQRGLESNCSITSIWREVQKYQFENIINSVISRLLQFLLEISKSMDNNIDVDILKSNMVVNKIINNTIYAGIYTTGSNTNINNENSTIIAGQENTVSIDSKIKSELETITKEIEKLSSDADADRTDIANEIIDIRTELQNKVQKPTILKKAFTTIKGIVETGDIFNLAKKAIDLISSTQV